MFSASVTVTPSILDLMGRPSNFTVPNEAPSITWEFVTIWLEGTKNLCRIREDFHFYLAFQNMR
ncbi:MAG: hypothetical protein OXM61_18760 [Candidatus Poribacteria bacterium]|nr:hypothetical protein [Candidatus Poribacteria bacterium]